jgi:hypothetical protein
MKGKASNVAVMSRGQLEAHEGVQQMLAEREVETTQKSAAYFLHSLMLAITTLQGEDKLATAKTLDNAVSGLLCDFHEHVSPEHCRGMAALLIHNIALFLDDERRDRVLAALDLTP